MRYYKLSGSTPEFLSPVNMLLDFKEMQQSQMPMMLLGQDRF